jgi:prolyl-tRNA editing enzyme YbaK/EbsC (Cys-tRNA(Pro) deacylase)
MFIVRKMNFGKLTFVPAQENTALLAPSVQAYLAQANPAAEVWVSAIDPSLADTAAFCEHYDIGLDVSANCVIVEAKRADRVWYAACIVLATTKADVNGAVRRALDARKISFAPMATATQLTEMEYGGITPIGLPREWPVFIDTLVTKHEKVIIGSGTRGSKILTTPKLLAELPNARVMDITKPSEAASQPQTGSASPAERS